MNIVKQSGLFYELLIRGVHAPGPGQKLGDLSEAHYIEGEALVDQDTGEVIQYKPGLAAVLPADKVAAYLGEKFVSLEAQLRETQSKAAADRDGAQKALAAAQAQHASETSALSAQHDAEKAALSDQIADLANNLSALRLAHDAAVTKNAAVAAALAG